MTLKREMVCSGHWLFRRRGWCPLGFVALLLLALSLRTYDAAHPACCTPWEAFCLFVAACGLGLRALTLGFVAAGTSGRNTTTQRADELNTAGIYSLVRHPLYLANYLIWLGVVLVPGIWWLPLTVTLGYWLYYERIMAAEEDFLQDKFGDTYLEWAGRTPAFVPRLSGWVQPERGFSLRFVMKREYATWLGTVTSFVLLELALQQLSHGGWNPGGFWLGLQAVALATYLILFVMRKHTRLLVQADR